MQLSIKFSEVYSKEVSDDIIMIWSFNSWSHSPQTRIELLYSIVKRIWAEFKKAVERTDPRSVYAPQLPWIYFLFPITG